MSDIDINRVLQNIKELQDQNAIDFQQWKRLGQEIKRLEGKIKTSDTHLNLLMKKIKSDYESLRKVIVDENVSIQLNNKIDENKKEINKKVDNETFYNSLNKINKQIDTKADKVDLNTLESRMDTFTKLPVGSTTGDAELIDGRVGANGEEYDNLGNAIRSQFSNVLSDGVYIKSIIDFSSYSNGYVTGAGVFVSDTAYNKTITLNKGETVRFYGKGYSTNVSLISKLSNGVYTPLVISTDNNSHWFEYTATENSKYVLCFTETTNIFGYILYKTKDIANNSVEKYMLDLKEYVAPFTDDCYINKTGNKVVGSNSSHVTSDSISLKKGDVILVTCSAGGVVSVISKVKNNSYTPLIIANAEVLTDYRYEALEDIDVVISATNKWDKKYSIYNKFNPNQLNEQYDITPSFSMFEKFAVIGDSYASGEVVLSGYDDYYNVSWGQILARMTGSKCLNLSAGGLSTRTWLTSPKGLSLLKSSEAQQLYILALGINDYYALGESYLGVKADIESKTDTFYGNYARIIEEVKTKAPKAKIIISTIEGTSDVVEKFNQAIIDLANHYAIPYLVQNNDEFFKSSYYKDNMLQGHPVATVYSAMAKTFKRMIEKCMFDNFNYFKDYTK